MFLPVSKILKIFFFLSIILAQIFALVSPTTTRAQTSDALTCLFKIKQDNVYVNKIVYNRSWVLEYSIVSPSNISQLDILVLGSGVKGQKKINITQLSGSINSTDILDSEPDPTKLITFGAAIQGNNVSSCGNAIFDYTDKVETSVVALTSSDNGGTLVVSARGFSANTKTVQVKFYNYFHQDKKLYDSPLAITSDPWFDTRPWPADSQWTIAELELCDAQGKHCETVSGQTLHRSESGACPIFATFNPSTPGVKDVVQVQYVPLASSTPDQFAVKVDKKDGDNQLVAAFGRWVADIGTFPTGGVVGVQLIRKSDNVVCSFNQLFFTGTFNPKDTSEFDASCTDDKGKTKTTFGCIAKNPTALVNALLPIAIGAGGGLAFLLIIYGGFRLATSQGDPKAVQDAREIITGAIIGLLIMILSVFILRLVGIDILGLPI